MSTVIGFPALSNGDAKILILGSMPGIKSLEQQQYYAHPRNGFWPIMSALYGHINFDDYQQKKALLTTNQIALWDVLKNCYRPGSLDAAIDQDSAECNDFVYFFEDHPNITQIFFNGAAAEKIYTQKVAPQVNIEFPALQYYRLPSTSPAHAAMSLTQKIEKWRIISTQINHNNI